MQLEHYFLLFIIYSFFGWLIEIINTLIIEGKFVNRGFLIGPYCPIYGVGALLITFALDRYSSDPLVLFVMSVILCCILEYLTSYLMEKLFNTRWWDYSDKKFNINGRICLEAAILFGLLGVLIIYILNPCFYFLLTHIPEILITILFIIILLFFVLDFAVSFKIITTIKTDIKTANLNTAKDTTEEISDYVRKILLNNTILNRRLVHAFPHFKVSSTWLKKYLKKLDKNHGNMNKK